MAEEKIPAEETQDIDYKAEYERLRADYATLVAAFNKLMDEYNQLHLQALLNQPKK